MCALMVPIARDPDVNLQGRLHDPCHICAYDREQSPDGTLTVMPEEPGAIKAGETCPPRRGLRHAAAGIMRTGIAARFGFGSDHRCLAATVAIRA